MVLSRRALIEGALLHKCMIRKDQSNSKTNYSTFLELIHFTFYQVKFITFKKVTEVILIDTLVESNLVFSYLHLSHRNGKLLRVSIHSYKRKVMNWTIHYHYFLHFWCSLGLLSTYILMYDTMFLCITRDVNFLFEGGVFGQKCSPHFRIIWWNHFIHEFA